MEEEARDWPQIMIQPVPFKNALPNHRQSHKHRGVGTSRSFERKSGASPSLQERSIPTS
jgi:hypothetical protein